MNKEIENSSTLLTDSLARKIEQSEVDYTISRIQGMRERKGNPMGIEIRSFGRGTAFLSRKMPWPQFNMVKGLTSEDVSQLDDIFDFYNQHGLHPQFETTPADPGPELMQALVRNGYEPGGFHCSLWSELTERFQLSPDSSDKVDANHQAVSADGLKIQPLTQDRFEWYGVLHCAGFGLPAAGAESVTANNRPLLDKKGWCFWLALWEDQPVGIAGIYCSGEFASLTVAAVHPDFRRRGVHLALILTRLDHALQAGCRYVVGQAAYGSGSHRNMQRAGLQLAYTRMTWKKRS